MLLKWIRMVLLVILAFSIFKPVDILQYEGSLKSELEICSVSYAAEKNDSDKVITKDTVEQMSDTELKEELEKAKDESTLYSILNALLSFVVVIFVLCLVLLIPSIFVGGIHIVGMGAIISIVAAIFLGIVCAIVEPDSVGVINNEIHAREEIKDNEKKVAEKYQKRDEEINKLTGQYKELFDESYQKYIAAGQNENEAKDNALADVNAKQKEDLKTQNDTQKKDIEKADKSKTDNVGTKYDLHISKTNFDKRFTEIVGKNTNKNSVYTERPLLSLYKNIEDNKGNKVYTYWVLDNGEFLMEQTVDKNDNLIGIKLVIQDLRFVDKDVYENFIGWTIQTVNPNMGWFKKKKIMFVLSPLSEGKHGCTEDGIIYAAICGNTKGAAIGLNKAMFIMVNENIKDYQ